MIEEKVVSVKKKPKRKPNQQEERSNQIKIIKAGLVTSIMVSLVGLVTLKRR